MIRSSKHATVPESRLRASRSLAGLALAAALIAPSLVMASPQEPANTAELVAAVQKTYAGVTSVRADYTQSIKNPMTGAEELTRGRIALERPRKFRVETGFPAKQIFIGDGATQWLYNVEGKEVIVQKDLGGGAEVTGLIDNLGKLSELFDVTMAPATTPPKPTHQLALKPKQAGGMFQRLDLTVTRQRYLLQELVLVDTLGSSSKMTFSGVQLGGDIPDAQFSFKAPAGVKVTSQ